MCSMVLNMQPASAAAGRVLKGCLQGGAATAAAYFNAFDTP